MLNDSLGAVLVRLGKELGDGATLAALHRLSYEQSHKSEYVLARLAKESEVRGAISESCAEWVKSGRWPVMSKEDALFLHERLFHACAFGRLLQQNGFSCAMTEPELMIWLLVDSWVRITCLVWKQNLENPD